MAVILSGCIDSLKNNEIPDLNIEPASAPLPMLRVASNRIVNSEGVPVVLKGLNICDIFELKEEGHWSEDYIKKAAAWGAKLIRVPVHPGTLGNTAEMNILP
jgi:hypothetical protein